MQAETPFPERDDSEASYKLSDGYRRLFERVLRYARETVTDPAGGNQHRQRVRWWSALALLRALASSPAAAAATLRTRAAAADTATPEEADSIGRRTVLDQIDDESSEGIDVAPGSDIGEQSGDETSHRRRLLELAREAEALQGAGDTKLQKAITLVRELIADGYQPIVFCRFIQTAEYVAAALREKLPKDVAVEGVTGLLPHDEREDRVLALAGHTRRVLVATDCLSEGINLQSHFSAVLHYDLSWNPTRHEQREGRVDRYGQPRSMVKVVTYYGIDNQIDGIVLDVLIRKHRTIRSSLGVSVPVPINADSVIEAIFEGILLRGASSVKSSAQQMLPGFEDVMVPQREELFRTWDLVADREKRSRTMFAQESIKVEEVARELAEVRSAIGSGVDLATFVRTAALAHGATVYENGVVRIDMTEAPRALREATGIATSITVRFDLPVGDDEVYISRTHPFAEGLATYVMDTALDPLAESVARRCGVIRTRAVARRTTLLLMRFRYHIITRQFDAETPLLAEECALLAFAGAPERAEWLDRAVAEALLGASADANTNPDQATHFLRGVLDNFDVLWSHLNQVAHERGAHLLESHRRVRTASRARGVSYRVEAQTPPDVLGVYIFLPVG